MHKSCSTFQECIYRVCFKEKNRKIQIKIEFKKYTFFYRLNDRDLLASRFTHTHTNLIRVV